MAPDDELESPTPDPTLLIDLAQMRMPFGRYEGRLLIDLPEPYVVWFRQKGFPRGRLGELFGLLYEVKANGLEYLVRPLRVGGAMDPGAVKPGAIDPSPIDPSPVEAGPKTRRRGPR